MLIVENVDAFSTPPIRKRLLREGGLQSRESFDDEHPGIHVIVLGLPVGERAVHQKLGPFGERRSVGLERAPAELETKKKARRKG
jgi:hypothetical protein